MSQRHGRPAVQPMPQAAPHTPRLASPRRLPEWLLLALIVAVTLAIRGRHLEFNSVEHFDEGVYASNLWFGSDEQFQYPQRHLYAPPLLPWLIEWTMILAGRTAGQVVIWPSLVAGCVTIAAVWWLARTMFGQRAALFAASLGATSGLHILLSRAALTDVVMLLWFVLAILLWERAGRTMRWAGFAATGMMVSLAWWTKYNGWLPLFIALVALGVRLLIRSPRRFHRRLWGWCVAAFVAAAGWSPYLVALQSRGGYSAVAANHRQYLVGLDGWWDSATRQCANLGYLSGWWNLDLLSLALGGVGAVIVFTRLWTARRAENDADDTGLAVAWYVVMAAVTPLYTPYPRLLLPWLAASWILSGVAVDTFLVWLVPERDQRRPDRLTTILPAALLILCLGVGVFAFPSIGRVHADRRGMESIAQRIRDSLVRNGHLGPADLPVVVYTFGEPALYFQLRAVGGISVAPIQTVQLTLAVSSSGPVPTFLAVGPHALRDREFQLAWPQNQDRYELLGTYSFAPSPLVLLDNYDPDELARGPVQEEVRLYRIREL